MEQIIKLIEEKIRQTHEGAEGIYEIGYEDALKYILSILRDANLSNNRG